MVSGTTRSWSLASIITARGAPVRCARNSVWPGKPKPALREGFLPVAETISPDAREVACRREGEDFMLCPLDGGEPQPLRGLETGEVPLGWTADGRSLYAGNLGRLPLDVYTVEAATGRRRLWKEINPADAAGLTNATAITITPDGQSNVCNFMRKLNVLFTVQGAQ